MHTKAKKMVQQVKALAVKLDNLSSIPETTAGGEKLTPASCRLTARHRL